MLRTLTKTFVVVVGSTILATLAVYAVDLRDQYYHTTALSGLVLYSQKDEGTCPENMVHVSQTLNPFCVDKYEVTPGKACTYKNPKNSDESALNLSNSNCTPESTVQKIPWRNVTLAQAKKACEQAGKRVPTPNEWFVSSFGTPDKKSSWQEDDCNVSNNRASGVSKTGSGMRCVSNAGAYDMVGNVWEWVDGVVSQGMYNDVVLPESGYVTGVSMNGLANTTETMKDENYFNDRFWIDRTIDTGIMRGGYFNSQDSGGVYATFTASPVTFSGDALGFRCVVDIGN